MNMDLKEEAEDIYYILSDMLINITQGNRANAYIEQVPVELIMKKPELIQGMVYLSDMTSANLEEMIKYAEDLRFAIDMAIEYESKIKNEIK